MKTRKKTSVRASAKGTNKTSTDRERKAVSDEIAERIARLEADEAATATGKAKRGKAARAATPPESAKTGTAFAEDGTPKTVSVPVDADDAAPKEANRPSSAPSPSDTVLIGKTVYDDFGRVENTQDYNSIKHATTYDFAGRRASTIANSTSGSPGGGTNKDRDITTEYTYTDGLVTSVNRRTTSSSGDDQVTTYTYGTTTGTSQIATGHLLSMVTYPEQVSSQPVGDRSVVTLYNALSEPVSVTDPNGTTIVTDYDAGGRAILRSVTAYGSGVGGNVQDIVTTYNDRGQVETISQKDGYSTVLDQIAYEYDGFGQLSVMTQDPDSAIGAASGRDEFVTTYAYSTYALSSSNRGLYLSSTTLPFGSTSGGEIVNSVADQTGRLGYSETGTYFSLAQYEYLGARTVVGFQGPYASNSLYGSGGSADYSSYMDRFNRPITNIWTKTATGVDFVDMQATLNRHGQVTELTDNVLKDEDLGTPHNNFDSLTAYDDLRRAIQREDGELTSGSISTLARQEQIPRIGTGRIERHRVDLDANGVFKDGPLASVDAGEMDDTRTYNKRNELRSRSVYDVANPSTPKSVNLLYDKNGNLTDDDEKYLYAYDAFNRLITITDKSTSSLQAVYTSNGLGQRISEQLDTNDSGNTGFGDGVVSGVDPIFFLALNASGQRVATYRDTDSKAKEVFYRHPLGIGGPLLGKGCGGGDLIVRERNKDLYSTPTTWATDAGDWEGYRDQFCTDLLGSVAAVIDEDGNLAEQYRYSPTGVPFGIPAGDMNGDGLVDAYGAGLDGKVFGNILGSTYEVRADLDLDGDVDSDDQALMTSADGNQTGRGRFGIASIREIYGYNQAEVFGQGLHTLWWCGEYRDGGLDIYVSAVITTSTDGPTLVPGPPPPANAKECLFQDWDTPTSLNTCFDYPPSYTYAGANARCFCDCMGDSRWSRWVRGCLKCMYDFTVPAHDAHVDCWLEGYERYPWSYRGTLPTIAYCAAKCWVYEMTN